MARPTARLDLYLVPPAPDEPTARRLVEQRLAAWERGEHVPDVGPKALRVDAPGARVLYANQLGGFHVTCSHCGEGLARAFQPLQTTRCPGCDRDLPFEEVTCRPPAALGYAALVLQEIEQAAWEDPQGWQVVLRRR